MSRIWEPGKATMPIRRVAGWRVFISDGIGFISLMLGKRRGWRNDIHRRISAIIRQRPRHDGKCAVGCLTCGYFGDPKHQRRHALCYERTWGVYSRSMVLLFVA